LVIFSPMRSPTHLILIHLMNCTPNKQLFSQKQQIIHPHNKICTTLMQFSRSYHEYRINKRVWPSSISAERTDCQKRDPTSKTNIAQSITLTSKHIVICISQLPLAGHRDHVVRSPVLRYQVLHTIARIILTSSNQWTVSFLFLSSPQFILRHSP